jgi:hypothetical protein
MQAREKPDRQCIRDLASFLEAIGQPGVAGVDRWPEDEVHGEIDAVVGPYAIQHTSIDSIEYGRLADKQFMAVIGDLEGELANKLGFPLWIVWHWSAIQKGQNWSMVNSALRDWIMKAAPGLADGRHCITNVPGVPFSFDIEKGGPTKFDGVKFARYDPHDATLTARLRDQLAGRHDKLTVLGRYRTTGKTTLLLLQSVDVPLMDGVKLVEALETAFASRPAEVDEVWFLHYVAPCMVNVHNLGSGDIWAFNTDTREIITHNPHGPHLAWAI